MEWEGEKKENAIDQILELISGGKSVRSILSLERDKELFPDRKTFNRWLKDDSELSIQYARACEARQEFLFDEIIDISDNIGGDAIELEDGRVVIDHAVVQRDRLRMDARKWALSKMNAKKYGDKIDHTTDGEKITPTVITWGGNDVTV